MNNILKIGGIIAISARIDAGGQSRDSGSDDGDRGHSCCAPPLPPQDASPEKTG